MRVSVRSTGNGGGTQQDATLNVWLLGSFRVAVGTRIIDEPAWRLRKARSLIKLLALVPGYHLHREQVMEALWSGLDPSAAANNLHQVLHFARHTLQPDLTRRSPPDYLQLQDDAITLAPPERLWVDVAAYEAAAATARQVREPAEYNAALKFYEGDLLPDDLYEEWAAPRRDELQQLQCTLLLELARSHEERKELSLARSVLGKMLAGDPANEEAHTRLMRLYALSGERHEALRQYDRLCEALERELGVKPDANTQRLYEEIRADRFPEPAVHAAQPEEATTAEAAGRRRLSRARVPASRLMLETPPGNVPAPLTSFIGRQRELAEIKEGLSKARLLTLVGTGGSGKTRLALQIAADVAAEFPDGAWFVDLAPLTDPAFVTRTTAMVLGVKEEPGRPLVAALVAHLKPKRLLLILDNCEHVAQSCAELCVSLLPACPRLQMLITSREALKVHGEMKWPVPPLSLPERKSLPPPADLAQFDAMQLFAERARLSRQGFRLTDASARATLEICRRLDGLPLAIELAAARLNVLSLDEILDRLSASLRLLSVDSRGVPGRHQTVRAAIDWSYNLLSPSEQVLFSRVSVFSGGFTMEAAEAVCAGEGVGADEVLDLLSHLVEKSMIVVEEARDGSVRYRLLGTLREYGWECLLAAGQSERAGRQHAQFFLALAQRFDPKLQEADQETRRIQLSMEVENFRAAVRWAIDHHDASTALQLGKVLGLFWLDQGYFVEGRRLLEEILTLPEAQEPTLARARVLKLGASLAWSQGDYKMARSIVEESLGISRRLGDEEGIAQVVNMFGLIARAQGDHSTARALYDESLATYQKLNHVSGIAMVLNNLGFLSLAQRDHAAARAFFQEKLEIERARGSKGGMSYALNGLGKVAEDQEDFTDAERLHAESLVLRRTMGDRPGIAVTLNELGRLAAKRDDAASALQLFDESLGMQREMGNRPGVAESLRGLGHLALKGGNYAAAHSCFEERISILRDLGAHHGTVRALEEFAVLAGVQGSHQRAILLAGAAAALRERVGAPPPHPKEIDLDQTVEVARDVLGKDAAAAAWADGQQMTLEQAVAHALAAARPLPVSSTERLPAAASVRSRRPRRPKAPG